MKPILPNLTNTLDPQGLTGLKRAAREGQPSGETLREVARQFEALFMNMMLKSMRDASFGDELFGGEQGNFYRDMYDQQLAQMLASQKGMGLADVLVRQLGGDRAGASDPRVSGALSLDRLRGYLGAEAPANATDKGTPADFVRQLWPHAERAGRALGVVPEAIVSIAALETGWGNSMIRHPDGRSANNLFGIKAGDSWQGGQVSAVTREVINGASVRRRENFRAYDSIGASVDDFAAFLRSNPRYREALDKGADARGFVETLARNGYATDPAYARKLGSILQGDSLRGALAGLKFPDSRPIPA